MKKQLLLFGFCLFFASFLKADEFTNKHGIGTITLQLDSLASLELWESPDDKTPLHFFSVQRDPANRPHFVFDNLKQDSIPSWFVPAVIFINNENSRLDFNCLEETSLYYKTNLQYEAGKYIWIQKTKQVKYLSWLDFYLSMASVQYFGDTVAIFDTPADRSGRFNYSPSFPRRIQITPLEIKGEWMKVDAFETNEQGAIVDKKYGWIRWRDEKKPLIKYNLMGC